MSDPRGVLIRPRRPSWSLAIKDRSPQLFVVVVVVEWPDPCSQHYIHLEMLALICSPCSILRHVSRFSPACHSPPFRGITGSVPLPPSISAMKTPEDNAQARSWIERFKSQKIPRDLVELTFSRSSGPGGQVVSSGGLCAHVRLIAKSECKQSEHQKCRVLMIITRAEPGCGVAKMCQTL